MAHFPPFDVDQPPSSRSYLVPPEDAGAQQDTRVIQVKLKPPPGRREGGDGAVDSSVSFLDRTQLEVRLHYPVHQDDRKNRYRLEAWFFVPTSLGVNAKTYERGDFYRDMLTYFSFDVPRIQVSAVSDGRQPGALLRRLTKLVAKLKERPDDQLTERTSWEMRLVGCLVGAHIEEHAQALAVDVKALRGRLNAEPERALELGARASRLLADASAMVLQIRGLSPCLQDPTLPRAIGETYRWVDEHLSLSLEGEWTRLIAYLDREPESAALRGLRRALVDAVTAEQSVRIVAGYRSVLGPESGSPEYLSYRREGRWTMAMIPHI